MLRHALPLALLLAACADETVGTATTLSTDTSTSTGEPAPTTSGETGSSGAPDSSGSDSATATTTGASSSTGTTQGLDETSSGESSTTSDETTTTTSTTGTTGLESTTSDDTTTTGDDTTSTTSTTSTTGDDTTTGEVVVPPVPAGVCNMAQGPLTTFVEPLPQVEELHMVAMYQATGNAVTVAINRHGVPLTVFLSSYEPVAFTLVVAPGVLLEHVILDGYNMHSVQGQGAATVTDISAVFNDPNWVACGYFWPMNDGGCETPANVVAAEAISGLELTTFAGCYEGVSFAID
jgi:hypothetical protein